jgi:hypothetical protein
MMKKPGPKVAGIPLIQSAFNLLMQAILIW